MLLDSTTNTMQGIVIIVIVIAAYFLPTFISYMRRNLNAGGVAVVNIFLGWTLLGWVIALAMAAGGKQQEDSPASPSGSPK